MNGTLLKHFGVPVSYQPADGPAVTVTGIFDAAYVHVGIGEAGFATQGPAVFLRLPDLPADPTMDTPNLVIGGVLYGVIEAKKDGQGGIVLRLQAQ